MLSIKWEPINPAPPLTKCRTKVSQQPTVETYVHSAEVKASSAKMQRQCITAATFPCLAFGQPQHNAEFSSMMRLQ
jgi:hypothetical protein